MNKSIEELLKPRVQLIALYPGCTMEVGQLETFESHNINETAEEFVKKYDKNFYLVPWYEHRLLKDLPTYIKLTSVSKKVVYYKVKWEHHFGNMPRALTENEEGRKDNFLSVDWHFSKQRSEPITEEEYYNAPENARA